MRLNFRFVELKLVSTVSKMLTHDIRAQGPLPIFQSTGKCNAHNSSMHITLEVEYECIALKIFMSVE